MECEEYKELKKIRVEDTLMKTHEKLPKDYGGRAE